MAKRPIKIDPDNPPMTNEELASLRPAREIVSRRLSPDPVKASRASNEVGRRDDIRDITKRADVGNERTKVKGAR